MKGKTLVRIPTSGQLDREVARWWAWAMRHTDLDIDFVYNTEGVDRTRNVVVEKFLGTEAQYLWMIDDDVVPPRKKELINRFLSWEYPIVSGFYDRFDGFVGVPQVYAKVEEERWMPMPRSAWPSKESVFRAAAAGAGCIRVHREVFEKMPYPWFEFREGIRDGVRFRTSEDFIFCDKAGGVVVDPLMECKHMRDVDLSKLRLLTEALEYERLQSMKQEANKELV